MADWKMLVFVALVLNIASIVQSKKRKGRNNSPDHGSDSFNPNAGYRSWLSFKNLASTPGDRGKGGKVVCKCPRGPAGPSGPRGPPGAEITEAHLLAKFRSLIRESAHTRSIKMRQATDQALALMATGAADIVSAFNIELKSNVLVPKRSLVELKNYKTNLGQYGTFVRGEDIDFRSGQFTVPYTAIYRFAAGINIARHRDASLRPRDLVKVLICIEYQCDKYTSLMTVSGLSSNSRVFTVNVEGLLSLKAGQHVSVYVNNSSGNPVVIQARSSFSGLLIGL